jgi:lipoprotein-anchoring transpeptidase ErfK/SrfK
MLRAMIIGAAMVAGAQPVVAQGFNPFGDIHTTKGAYGVPASRPAARAPMEGRSNLQGPATTAAAPTVRRASLSAVPQASPDGGGRPSISGATPSLVAFTSGYGAGSVVIDSGGRSLYYVTSSTQAYRYPVAVGREGFAWTGTERVSRKAEWPEWRPPAEMRQRVSGLPEVMSGGLRNPLGARAIYLGSTLYRIHGTNDTRSIGSASSSGCFRMSNAHVVDLANRVSVGASVHVVGRLPASVSRGVADSGAAPTAKSRRG